MSVTYLDAGVLIAALRAEPTVQALAWKLLDDRQRRFASSIFLRLEVLPKPMFHGRIQETTFLQRFFTVMVAHEPPDLSLVAAEALTIATEYGLGACDALHVAAARNCGCDELVTTERTSSPLFRVRSPQVRHLTDC